MSDWNSAKVGLEGHGDFALFSTSTKNTRTMPKTCQRVKGQSTVEGHFLKKPACQAADSVLQPFR